LTSQGLAGSFRSCMADLERLEKKLAPNPVRTAMRRYGVRALKWPFTSKDVDQLLAGLERHEKNMLLGLQVDQTYAHRQNPITLPRLTSYQGYTR
jgi:hypothetical protein